MKGKASKELLSKLMLPASLFIFVLLFGMIGFHFIEDYTFLESLYITVITISTVGYGEVRPLSDEGRVFTIILILLNLGIFSYLITLFSKYITDGDYIKNYKLLKMEKRINHLKDHVIICGFGRNGKQTAEIFDNNHIPYVLIEKSTQDASNKSQHGYYICGDATNDETLMEAGIKKAKYIVSTLPADTDNLFVVLTARQLNPDIKIISRATNDTSVSKLKVAGANNVIMPDKIGGAHMASLVMIPDVVEVISLLSTRNNTDFKVVEINLVNNFVLGEKDLWKTSGVTVLAIKKNNADYVLNPEFNSIAYAGESMIIMGSEAQINKAKKIIQG